MPPKPSHQHGHDNLFGKYDIRGVFGKDLDITFAYQLGTALASFFSADKQSRFLVGHDVRESSPPLAEALLSGLVVSGQIVDCLHLASTPHVYWHGANEKYCCSVSVTASHLPAEYMASKSVPVALYPLVLKMG